MIPKTHAAFKRWRAKQDFPPALAAKAKTAELSLWTWEANKPSNRSRALVRMIIRNLTNFAEAYGIGCAAASAPQADKPDLMAS